MPASMAGSRGGTVGTPGIGDAVAFGRRLLSGAVGLIEYEERMLAPQPLRTVTLVINNACNLACAHCYLQVRRLGDRALTQAEWHRVLGSVSAVKPELVCLSGKEVFLGGHGISLLEALTAASAAAEHRFRTGVITNGTMIGPLRERIAATAPSYFDISLDGLESDHDAVRSPGAFRLAWPNVLWAVETFGPRFFVTLTTQRQNADRLPEAIQFLAKHGVRNVEVGFYVPLTYTNPALALSDGDLDRVFARLAHLGEASFSLPLRVHFDLDLVGMPSLLAFLRSQWFAPEWLQEDGNGELFVEHSMPNGVALIFRLSPMTTGVARSMRLTPEGWYLAAEDTIDTTRYAERRIGSIRAFDYDLAALHAHARCSPRYRELLRYFHSEQLPHLVAAAARRSRRAA